MWVKTVLPETRGWTVCFKKGNKKREREKRKERKRRNENKGESGGKVRRKAVQCDWISVERPRVCIKTYQIHKCRLIVD